MSLDSVRSSNMEELLCLAQTRLETMMSLALYEEPCKNLEK